MPIGMPTFPCRPPTHEPPAVIRVETRVLYGQTVAVKVLAPGPVLVTAVVHIEHQIAIPGEGQGRISPRRQH